MTEFSESDECGVTVVVIAAIVAAVVCALSTASAAVNVDGIVTTVVGFNQNNCGCGCS